MMDDLNDLQARLRRIHNGMRFNTVLLALTLIAQGVLFVQVVLR